MALTFVNQVGAVEGMNQAAPGTLIPESFVRFSQDVLFDRAGLMRRRGPFDEFKLYKTNATTGIIGEFDFTDPASDNETILGVLSTYDPTGKERIGMLVHRDQAGVFSNTLRVFDSSFKFLGEEVLPFTAEPLSILTAKPALGGGLWVSLSSDPVDPDKHYQFFWRGGYSSTRTGASTFSSVTGNFTYEEMSTAGFSSEHDSLSKTINTVSNRTNVSVGQFVFARFNSKDYYLGTVKEVPVANTSVVLEKHPFIWDSVIDNNHTISYTTVSAAPTATNVTITVNDTVLFEQGDIITISGVVPTSYNGNWTLTGVSGSTLTFNTPTNLGNITTQGTIKMDNDLVELSKSGVSLRFTSVRPFHHVHGRGLLTIEDGDATTILSGTAGTSAEGHWQAARVQNYNVYRSSDNAYIGKIKTVNSNVSATLYSDPGINLRGEEYIMEGVNAVDLTNDFRVGADERNALNFAGLYTAVYAGYQWYGNFAQDDQNTNRVMFSASHDPEAVDLSRDAADSIIFPGKSKFRGLAASSVGLLVFLEDRTYILRGNDRSNFSVEQLVPEGCLCPSSIVEYGGGVFWAGKSGIMYFDGASVRNLTKDNLGLYYTDSLDVFNPEQDRVIGFIHKNNLVMHYTTWKAPFDPIRYEPLYADDWNNAPDKYGKTSWTDFDLDFDQEDFFTQNNTPIFWDRKILNSLEESASLGNTIKWGAGTQRAVTASSTVTGTPPALNTITLTIGSGHGLVNGDNINVVGVHSSVNGLQTITSTTTTTVSFLSAGSTTASTGFVSKNTGNVYGSTSSLNKYGPLRKNTSVTFAIYLPTNALTTLSNMDFRGVTATETINGLKTIVGVNSVENDALRARLIDVHPVFDVSTNGSDALLIEKINVDTSDLVLGPDFYLQTKHFTVGDPILRKWFQRVMISMLLYDGAIRMDLVDDDDNDEIDINKKKAKYWEVFTSKGYSWQYLTDIEFPKVCSPQVPAWQNVEKNQVYWDDLFTSDFNRYSKRISWRKPSIGFRLYQLNKYKKPYNGVVTTPNRVEMQGFSIGFKPLRQGRV